MTKLEDAIRRYAEAVSDPAAIGRDPSEEPLAANGLAELGLSRRQDPAGMNEYREVGQQRPIVAKRLLVLAAVVLVAVGAAALIIAQSPVDRPTVSVSGVDEAAFPLPPAGVGNLSVAGRPDRGAGFSFDDAAGGGKVTINVYDWAAMGLDPLVPIYGEASLVPVSIDGFEQVYVGCIGSPADRKFGYATNSSVTVTVTVLEQPGACDPDEVAGHLSDLLQSLRLVPRSEWEGYVRENAVDVATSPQLGAVQGTLTSQGGPQETGATALAGTVRINGEGQTFIVPTNPAGEWNQLLPVGSYTVEATSPLYNDGNTACTANTGPVEVAAGTTQTVNVTCHLR